MRAGRADKSAAELGALAEVAFEVADTAVTTTVQDMHRAIAGRAFVATGPLGAERSVISPS